MLGWVCGASNLLPVCVCPASLFTMASFNLILKPFLQASSLFALLIVLRLILGVLIILLHCPILQNFLTHWPLFNLFFFPSFPVGHAL